MAVAVSGFETEMMTDFSIGANGTYRKLKDFYWYVGEHHQGQGDLYSPADFTLHAPAVLHRDSVLQ